RRLFERSESALSATRRFRAERCRLERVWRLPAPDRRKRPRSLRDRWEWHHSLELLIAGWRESGGRRHSRSARAAARRAGKSGHVEGDEFVSQSHISRLAVPVSARDHVEGPEAAPVTLVEYGDYQCPYCGAAYPIVKRVQQRL